MSFSTQTIQKKMNELYAEPKIEPEEIVRELLNATQTIHPPTDADLLAQYLNLTVIEFNDSYRLDDSVRAFLNPKQRLIGLHPALSNTQRAFSILHEIGHFVLPGHSTHPDLVGSEGIISDTGQNLSARSIVKKEIEANQFAADCIFQLDRFTRLVLAEPLRWKNIVSAAKAYRASFEATARRWVEKSDEACALVVFQPSDRKQSNSVLRVMYTITSEAFKNVYFENLVSGYEMDRNSAVHRFFHNDNLDSKTSLEVNTAQKGSMSFQMDMFNNSYRVFGLLTPYE